MSWKERQRLQNVKNEKCTCKASKTIVFRCQICKFVTILWPSWSCLLKLPNHWFWTTLTHFCYHFLRRRRAPRHSKGILWSRLFSGNPGFHCRSNGEPKKSFANPSSSFTCLPTGHKKNAMWTATLEGVCKLIRVTVLQWWKNCRYHLVNWVKWFC